jgi:poly(beta-D-mannuronate) C5 epimerase
MRIFSYTARIIAGAWLCSYATVMLAEPAMALSSTQQEYLRAENLQGKEAITAWKSLLSEKSLTELTPGISRSTIRLNIIQALLESAEAGNTLDYEEAIKAAEELENELDRVWALAAIMRHQFEHLELPGINARTALSTYDDAKRALRDVSSMQEKSYAAAGIVRALLATNGSEFPEMESRLAYATDMLTFIRTAEHIAEAQQLIARRELIEKDKNWETLLSSGTEDEIREKAMREARIALRNDRFEQALQYALVVPFTRESYRKELLQEIAGKAENNSDLTLAVEALRGIHDDIDQSDALYIFAEKLIESKELPLAVHVAEIIDDGRYAADTWIYIARAYEKLGYQRRTARANNEIWDAASRIEDPDRQERMWANVAKHYAEQGRVARARKALKKSGDSKRRFAAIAALAKKEAETTNIEQAIEDFTSLPADKPALRARAFGAIVKAYAEQHNMKRAVALLKEHGDISGEDISEARLALVKAYLEQDQLQEAEKVSSHIEEQEIRAEALALIAHAQHKSDPEQSASFFEKSRELVTSLEDSDSKQKLAGRIAVLQAQVSAEDGLQKTKALLTDIRQQSRLQKAIALRAADEGDFATAEAVSMKIPDVGQRDEALRLLVEKLSEQNELTKAATLARNIEKHYIRVRVLRRLAQEQAAQQDQYGILHAAHKSGEFAHRPLLRNASHQKPLNKKTRRKFEENMISLADTSRDQFLLNRPPSSPLGQLLPPMTYPERLLLQTEHLRGMIPESTTLDFHLIHFENTYYNKKFLGSGHAGYYEMQNSATPRVLYLEGGTADISSLHQELKRKGLERYLLKEGRVYTLRLPIIIGDDAALVVSNADVDTLRMSRNASAYIVNSGELYVLDTHILGWDEGLNSPAHMKYVLKEQFRPFITGWSKSRSFIAGSVLESLGYSNSKAYGLSFSAGPKAFLEYGSGNLSRPTATIVENSFINLLYGFYSYEADHVSLIGNEYKDNVTYGIDPHDRSRWLTIAYNTAYGTEKKHGIIISREVNHSSIVGNISFDNHGSGFMIDRMSIGTLLYGNSAWENGQDGLTFFESGCNIVASNSFFKNKRAGIKVRNSIDIGLYHNNLYENEDSAIHGYIANLKADPAHAHRDFDLDPFYDVTAMNVVGNTITNNGTGVNVENVSAMLLRNNDFVNQSPRLLRGEIGDAIPKIMTSYNLDTEGVLVSERCPSSQLLTHTHCPFREQGFFDGDGQSMLAARAANKINSESCTPTYLTSR